MILSHPGFLVARQEDRFERRALELSRLGDLAPIFTRLRFQLVSLDTGPAPWAVPVQTDGPPATWDECEAADRLAERDDSLRGFRLGQAVPLRRPEIGIDPPRRAELARLYGPDQWELRHAREEGKRAARREDKFRGLPLAVAEAFYQADKATQDVLLDAFEEITGKRPRRPRL